MQHKHVSGRDSQNRVDRITKSLSQLNIEQRELVQELHQISRDIQHTEPRHHREAAASTVDASGEHLSANRPMFNSGDRTIVTNSRNRNERRATVSYSDSNKVHFTFDSGRVTWRPARNVRHLREDKELH